jgi:hypothetical protein
MTLHDALQRISFYAEDAAPLIRSMMPCSSALQQPAASLVLRSKHVRQRCARLCAHPLWVDDALLFCISYDTQRNPAAAKTSHGLLLSMCSVQSSAASPHAWLALCPHTTTASGCVDDDVQRKPAAATQHDTTAQWSYEA